MAKKMSRNLISLMVILIAFSFAVAGEIHPGLKNAIDNGDYKMAKNLVEKVGVEDLYCPASLNVDDAEEIYATRDTLQIGRCFRCKNSTCWERYFIYEFCAAEHFVDSSFFDRYVEKHCTSITPVSKKICADWIKNGDRNKVYDSFYKWFEEGKGVCQNVESMDFCKWLVGNTKDEYRMKFFRQLENKKLLKYKIDVEFDTTVVEVIPKKECLAIVRDFELMQTTAVYAKTSGQWNFLFGSCYLNGTKKAQKKCLDKLQIVVKNDKSKCQKGTATREVEKRLKRKDFVIPLKEEMKSVWYEMRESKWYQMTDEWWDDYNLLSKYLGKETYRDGVESIKSSYSSDGNLDITHLVRNCKIDPSIDKKVQKEFGFELFSCKDILEKYPAYLGRKCDTENSSSIMKALSTLYGKDSSVILVCDKKEGVYRLPDSTELTIGRTCENPTKSWIDSTRKFVCDKKLGKFRNADNLEKESGLICEDPVESWIDSTNMYVCDKKLGHLRKASEVEQQLGLCENPTKTWIQRFKDKRDRYGRQKVFVCDATIGGFREGDEFEQISGKLCKDPKESWIDPSHKVVCDKKTGKFRYANNIENMVGLCENPTKSWIDSTRTIVCDKKIGNFRDAYEPEKGLGLCDAGNQKKEYQSLYTCLGDFWHFTKEVNAKDLKFEKGKFVKGKVNPKYFYFKDFRDNKIYRAVKIGNQTWMAENMGYETNSSKCSEYCSTDGRLYTWDDAKNVCPNGWHLPDTTEWKNLFKSVNNSLFALQAKDFRVWPNATDTHDFSLLPAGFILEDNGKNRNGDARFWLNDRYKKRYVVFGARSGDFGDYAEWGDRYSVRCVKD